MHALGVDGLRLRDAMSARRKRLERRLLEMFWAASPMRRLIVPFGHILLPSIVESRGLKPMSHVCD